jgi:hypothetical protein
MIIVDTSVSTRVKPCKLLLWIILFWKMNDMYYTNQLSSAREDPLVCTLKLTACEFAFLGIVTPERTMVISGWFISEAFI